MLVCLLFGLGWALAAVVGGAATDGIPAEDYEPYNRFALGGFLLLAVVLYPTAFLITYTTAQMRNASFGRSFGIAHAVTALLALPMYLLLASP